MHSFKIETRTVEQIISSMSEEDREALERWAHLASRNQIAAGGIGQTQQEAKAAREAWESLSPEARAAHDAIDRALLRDYLEGRKVLGEAAPEQTGAETVYAIVGHDWPGYRYLSAEEIAVIGS